MLHLFNICSKNVTFGKNLVFMFRILVNFPTRVERGLLHVRDHGYRVRDFSRTLDVQEHANNFHSSCCDRYISSAI